MVDYTILDAWEAKYVRKLKDKELIAWTDAEAIFKYPKYKWVYDKLALHLYLDMVPTWDLWHEIPTRYPKFAKPRINVNGMGFKSGIVNSIFELYDRGLIGTHIIQPILRGEHLSTDLVWNGDKLIDYFTFYCHYDKKGSLILFESVDKKPPKKLLNKLKNIGEGRRVMNVETIGEKPLEVHLRPSVQFFDICGGLLPQITNFVKTGHWTKVKKEKTYSRVYRSNVDCRMARPKKIPSYPTGIRSIQFCWEKQQRLSKHTQDPSSFRYMVINGSNIRAIERYHNEIYKLIKIYP